MQQTPTEYMKQRELTLNLNVAHIHFWLKRDGVGIVLMNAIFAGNNVLFNDCLLEKFSSTRMTSLVCYCN